MQLNQLNQRQNNGGDMKKILSTVMIAAMLSSAAPAQAAESKVMQYLIDYGIPCVLSFGAGMLLADESNTGTAIGGAGCIAIGGATYLQQRREQKARELNEANLLQIQGMIDSSHKDRDSAVDSRLKSMEEAQKTQIEELKVVLREVLAERMLTMEGEMKEYLTKQLESGALMPKLEENLKSALKKEVVTEVKARQKEVVEKCVEETIKEVISRPIGVPENNTGVEQ